VIPYGRQDINDADVDAVVEVLRSDFLTQGPVVPRFEDRVAHYCGAKHGIAVNSATSALHIACLSLGVGPGDFVWTTPITFVATANCALYCGASVDFVDIDPVTYNLSVERLSEKLEQARRNRRLPKVVIPVHMCGQSCDMAGIHALSEKYGFRIVEDASHAIGARFRSELVGNCCYSDITVFSFHPVKIVTSGEGGMAMTNDTTLASRMRRLRTHGTTNDKAEMQPRPADELWNYQQVDIGYNYRLTDIHAALGLSQMDRIDAFVHTRRHLARRYDRELLGLPLTLPRESADCESSYHLYVVRVRQEEAKKTRRQIYDSMRIQGIGVNLHYIPVYRQPVYERLGFSIGYCREAENYFASAISIPMYSRLTAEEQDTVISALGRAFTA
jgi:UDP-4-amino-4,6-dideoxy-N-acetyl-beta-L-altrosamine transaminase